jgi:hypothetical protein
MHCEGTTEKTHVTRILTVTFRYIPCPIRISAHFLGLRMLVFTHKWLDYGVKQARSPATSYPTDHSQSSYHRTIYDARSPHNAVLKTKEKSVTPEPAYLEVWCNVDHDVTRIARWVIYCDMGSRSLILDRRGRIFSSPLCSVTLLGSPILPFNGYREGGHLPQPKREAENSPPRILTRSRMLGALLPLTPGTVTVMHIFPTAYKGTMNMHHIACLIWIHFNLKSASTYIL